MYSPAKEEPNMTKEPNIRGLFQMFLMGLPATMRNTVLGYLDTKELRYTLTNLFLATLTLDMRTTKHTKCLTIRGRAKAKSRSLAFLTKADQTGFLPGAKEAVRLLMEQPKLTPEEAMASLRKDKNHTAAIKFLDSNVSPRTIPSTTDLQAIDDKMEGMRQILTNSLAAEADRRKVETAERKRIHKEQKRALDAREESIHERVAALGDGKKNSYRRTSCSTNRRNDTKDSCQSYTTNGCQLTTNSPS
jgi:hypothetical protein